MARVIILTVPNNGEAESFARWMLDSVKEGYNEDPPVVPPGTKIEAMIARPTSYCRGPHRVPGRQRSESGWTRTKRFGWWICSICKKPAPMVVRHFIDNMCGGYNNLLPELDGGEPTPPRHMRPIDLSSMAP